VNEHQGDSKGRQTSQKSRILITTINLEEDEKNPSWTHDKWMGEGMADLLQEYVQ
jgi:hypothetical protein